MCQRLTQRDNQPQYTVHLETLLLNITIDRHAINKLHHQERQLLLGHASVHQRRDSRMLLANAARMTLIATFRSYTLEALVEKSRGGFLAGSYQRNSFGTHGRIGRGCIKGSPP